MEALRRDAYDQLHDLTEEISRVKAEFVVRSISPNHTPEIVEGLEKTLTVYSEALKITDTYLQRSLQARVDRAKTPAEDLVEEMRKLVERAIKIRRETLGKD